MPFWMRIGHGQECIATFERACEARYLEGADLIERGGACGGFYLQGYVAETALKAAVFQNLGYRNQDPISARERTGTGIPSWEQHDPSVWMSRLIAIRASRPFNMSFEQDLRRAIQVIQDNWSVDLRYRDEEPTPQETQEFTNAVEWIIMNKGNLV